MLMLCLRGESAKLESRYLPLASSSLIVAMNSSGLSSDLRVIAASMNVLAYVCTWIFWVGLNALVEYLVLGFREELVFLDFFLKGEFSPVRSNVSISFSGTSVASFAKRWLGVIPCV
jgi:hypothetical protein